MATAIAIPSGIWIRLPGTNWEVFQESGKVMFLGDEPATVQIRQTSSIPRIWGPRPPLVGMEPGGGITR
jgi:hypothetical protein